MKNSEQIQQLQHQQTIMHCCVVVTFASSAEYECTRT